MVPFLDLAAQYRSIKGEVDPAIARVLETSQFILGDAVAAFEAEFARFVDARHAIGVNSGTSALHLALLAAGVGPDDAVITTPFTFVATVAAIRYVGARPVFADVDERTGNIDPSRLPGLVTPRTKAVIPVHLYGQPANLDPILEITRSRGLALIEDAAQAHGAEYGGRRVGAIGDLGCFSFYPGKNLGAFGEAGMVVTNDDAHARTIRMLRDWGQERKYHHVLRGYNYRMEGLQGAVLGVKLRHLEDWTARRRAHAARYQALLEGTAVTIPREAERVRHVWHVFAIRTADRDGLQKHLTSREIQTGIHYPFPVHLLEAHRDLGYREGDFPLAERWARTTLSLPIYPELHEEQVAEVAEAVRSYKGSAVTLGLL